MNYTQGEWKATKSALGDWVISTKDTIIASEIRHFNAYLIASAPELYEACKLALDVMVAVDTERKVISGLSLRLNDALLKAEGREIK